MNFRFAGPDGLLLPKERRFARHAARFGVVAVTLSLVAWSAVLAKEARHAPALLAMSAVGRTMEPRGLAQEPELVEDVGAPVASPSEAGSVNPYQGDPNVRWFNGRPIRPARTLRMTVTAYSPDAASCGDSADGITATLHSVETNGFRLVAADPRILKYGSMISVPGYDSGLIVPVLDCGSAIKGHRLDVIFPTHEQARAWGVKNLNVTVWEYADGRPAENPRKLR